MWLTDDRFAIDMAKDKPLLAVGSYLAHLSRSVPMGEPQTCGDYRLHFRSAHQTP